MDIGYTAQAGPFAYAQYLEILLKLEGVPPEGLDLSIDLSEATAFFAEGMAPLISLIAALGSVEADITIEPPRSQELRELWATAGWIDALEDEGNPEYVPGSTFLPLVSYADGRTLNGLQGTVLDVLVATEAFSTGVLEALMWSLNEVADNVLIHAGPNPRGWMQVTYYPDPHQVGFVIVDNGRGILDSLAEAYPYLDSSKAALELAVKKGIRRTSESQGNGLAGLVALTKVSGGWASLHSGDGNLRVEDGELVTRDVPTHPGTLVTLLLPTDRPIDISQALWGHTPVPFLERYIPEEGPFRIHFRLSEEAAGFGNRETGYALRVKLLNLMSEFPKDPVVLDFEGVEFITASFADEFLSKLVLEVGIAHFLTRIRVRNANSFVLTTIDHVTTQRLGDSEAEPG